MEAANSLNIGQAAEASGVSAKMIRYYEQVGLFPRPRRTHAGYRQFSATEVSMLRFIAHARDLGFSIQQIGELVGLWNDRMRPSRLVKALAQEHIAELERKVGDLLAMKRALEDLANRCHGDDRPDCPILASLEDEAQPIGERQAAATGLGGLRKRNH